MKSKSVLFALLVLVFSACSDNENTDPVLGEWKHSIIAPLQVGWTTANPKPEENKALVTTFRIARKDNSYIITDISSTYDGETLTTTGRVDSTVVIGQSIGKIIFEGEDFSLELKGVTGFDPLNKTAVVQRALIRNPGDAITYKSGSFITKP